MFIIQFYLYFKSLHSQWVLLYRDPQDTAALVFQYMEEVALAAIKESVVLGIAVEGNVVWGAVVVGTAVVGADMVLPVDSYLLVQQPFLGVPHNQVAV